MSYLFSVIHTRAFDCINIFAAMTLLEKNTNIITIYIPTTDILQQWELFPSSWVFTSSSVQYGNKSNAKSV